MHNLNTINLLNNFLESIQLSHRALFQAAQSTLDSTLTISQDSMTLLCESIISITDFISETSSLTCQSVYESCLATIQNISEITKLANDEVYNIFESFFENLSISENEISVSNDDLQSVSEVIDLPLESLKSKDKTTLNSMSWQDFWISVLIPIILALLTMWQSKYYHDLDTLNSEHQQLEESEYQERLIEIQKERLEVEQEILFNLEVISNSLEELQEGQQFPEVPLSSLELHPTESPNFQESADSANKASDGSGTHNESEVTD